MTLAAIILKTKGNYNKRNKDTMSMSHLIQNINKEIEIIIKVPNKTSGVKRYK